MVKRIQAVYVTADDVNDARRFYDRLLGRSPKFVDGERWVQYDIDGTSFAIASPEESAVANGVVAVFDVDDLAASRQFVEGEGGAVLETRDMGSHGSVMTVRDPYNTVIQLFTRAN